VLCCVVWGIGPCPSPQDLNQLKALEKLVSSELRPLECACPRGVMQTAVWTEQQTGRLNMERILEREDRLARAKAGITTAPDGTITVSSVETAREYFQVVRPDAAVAVKGMLPSWFVFEVAEISELCRRCIR
jgi:hypothetical protein